MRVFILLCGLSGLAAGDTISTKLELGDSLTARLTLEKLAMPVIGTPRATVWMRWENDVAANRASCRGALGVTGFIAGPLLLAGGLREITSPHASSSVGKAWREPSSTRLDGSLKPVTRRGISLFPGSLPMRANLYETDIGFVAATSITLTASDRPPLGLPAAPRRISAGWIEATGVFGRPNGSGPENPDPGWFSRSPVLADTTHLLLRGRLEGFVGGSWMEIAPAAGFSFCPVSQPGGWWRLGTRIEGRQPSGRSVSARASLTTPHFRPPLDLPPETAATAALSVESDVRDRWRLAANGLVAWAWHPSAKLAGVPLTVDALLLTNTQARLGTGVRAGNWQMDISSDLEAVWLDPSSSGSLQTAHGPVFAGELAATLAHKVKGRDANSLDSRLSLALDHSRSHDTITASLGACLGRADLERSFALDVGAEGGFERSQTGFVFDKGTLECRADIASGTLHSYVAAGIECRPAEEKLLRWSGSLGWRTGAATSGE